MILLIDTKSKLMAIAFVLKSSCIAIVEKNYLSKKLWWVL